MQSNLDSEIVTTLASARSTPSVSIYVPSAEKGAEVEQGPIRLKNALSEASSMLEEAGHRKTEITRLLAKPHDLLTDADFWLHQGKGLGVLLSSESTEILRLPHSVEGSVTVSDRFHIRPLVPLLAEFTIPVLAISRGSRRLFSVSRHSISEVEIDAPDSMADANWFVDRESQLQSRPSTSGTGFHGHGDAGRAEHADLARYLRAVADAVATVTEGPVMLAATDDTRGAYRSACGSAHPLLDVHIAGNRDQARPEAIQREAVELASTSERAISKRRSEAQSRSLELDEFGAIVAAAAQGRVAELLVDVEEPRQWGTFDLEEMEVTITSEPGNGRVDLTDLAIEIVLRHGGTVIPADVDTPAIALLRY